MINAVKKLSHEETIFGFINNLVGRPPVLNAVLDRLEFCSQISFKHTKFNSNSTVQTDKMM